MTWHKAEEAAFWDKKAGSSVCARYYWDVITTEDKPLYEITRYALERLGDVRGKNVLDCGCGLGGLTRYFASSGNVARIVALDLSMESVKVAYAAGNGTPLEKQIYGVCASADQLPFKDSSFQCVVGSFVLHHIEDIALFSRELQTVMAEGGRAVFIENSGDNMLLMFFRDRVLPFFGLQKSSPHEYPLTHEKINSMRPHFTRVEVHYPRLVFFRLIASYFFRDFKPVRWLAEKVDAFIGFVCPPMLRQSYFRVIELVK